ncbi:hypothetical protein QG37_06858 [Candidozyma auris]|nr:hypothetical protein QG37_06858 [[Candida] auris]
MTMLARKGRQLRSANWVKNWAKPRGFIQVVQREEGLNDGRIFSFSE